MSGGREIIWVDGVNSVVAAHFRLMDNPAALLAHCNLGTSVHPDSHRFIDDVEQWLGTQIIRLQSPEFANADEVFEKRRYLSGVNGAPCTGELKFAPRWNFQLPSDIHVWGYTADKTDAKRFYRLRDKSPDEHHRAPLIDMGVRKKHTHEILRQHGVRRPYVYDIGMPNGNCLCCVKSSSPYYWAHQRHWFPEAFARRCEQARRFGARLVIMGQYKDADGKRHNIRVFPDEIPAGHSIKIKAADFGGCGFHCPTEMAA